MHHEKSCGALVLRRDKIDGKYYILMIRHRMGGHRSFPKGHMERGETERMTAVREVYEEMGITEVNMSREQVDFLGETVEAIRLSGAYEDVPLYSLQLCLERGSYLCVVTFNSYVEDTTETLMKFFRPFVAEEEEK